MSEKEIVIAILGIALILGLVHIYNTKAEVDMAKAGLEQCLEGTKILWKKSCK